MIYINLKNPKSVNSKSVSNEILNHIKNGVKTNEISFIANFVTNDTTLQTIKNDFQKVKNRLAFNLKNL